LVLLLVLASPYYSDRFSLFLHGRPFARVVAREKLDVFQFVSTDNLSCAALVFSRDKPVGWICRPMCGFSRFVPFSGRPDLGDVSFDLWADLYAPLAWSCRWWLLAAQAILLLLYARLRQKAAQEPQP
jgi:hypothetical protein